MISGSISSASTPARPNRWAGLLARALSTMAYGALACTFLVLLAVGAMPMLGYRPILISGGSMEPGIHAGSLVFSQLASPDSLKVGDVITFRHEGAATTVTHRIVAIKDVQGKPVFTTRGDANGSSDPNSVSFSGDVYRGQYTVSWAGYIVAVVRSPQGLLLLIALPAIGLAARWVLGMGNPRPREEEV